MDLLVFRNYLTNRPKEEENGWQNFLSAKAEGRWGKELCPRLLGG